MIKYNTIFTDEEYMAQGFTKEECPKIRRHDILFNKNVDGLATEEEREEMFALIEELKI